MRGKVFVAKGVSMASPFQCFTFEWLRRLNACGVSVASPFECFTFECFTFEWLRRLNGYAV